MGLFEPIWMTDKTKKMPKAIATVEKMSDPRQLKEVALQAKFSDIKLAACAKIDDPYALAEVAVAGDFFVAQRLLERLSGHNDLLKQVALRYASNGKLVAKAIDAMSAPTAADLAKLRLAVTNAHCSYDIARGRTKVYSEMTQIEQNAYQQAKTQVSKAIGRAMGTIADGQELYAAIKTLCAHGWSVPGFSEMLARLTPEQLRSLEQDSEVNQEVRVAAHEKAGHDLDSRCTCRHCRKTGLHRFEKDVCKHCGGRRVVETEELKDRNMGSELITYGRIERAYLVFPDGKRVLEREDKHIDKGAWNYLYG